MKNVKKLLLCLLLVVATLVALVSCDDKPQPKQLTDLTLPTLKSTQVAVIIKNGENDYTSYTVSLNKIEADKVTCEDVLAYLEDEADLTLDWYDSSFGKTINGIGGISATESNQYVEVFTSNAEYQGTWAGVDKYEVGEVTLVAANYGVSGLGVAAGDVIYFELASF